MTTSERHALILARQLARRIDWAAGVVAALGAHAYLQAMNLPYVPRPALSPEEAAALDAACTLVRDHLWRLQVDHVPEPYVRLLGREVVITTGGASLAGRVVYLDTNGEYWEAITDEGLSILLNDSSVWEPYRREGPDV